MDEKIFDNSGAKRAQLPEDILYIIAEKMLFTKPESSSSTGFFNEINLCKNNPYTLFMVSFSLIYLTNSILKNHTEKNFTAFTSHFAKMKRIEFSKYNKREKISFYKDAEHKFITSDVSMRIQHFNLLTVFLDRFCGTICVVQTDGRSSP